MEGIESAKSTADSNVPSCESCRRRKLKCTREQPSCVNCDKFDVSCIYDYGKKKPGFKVGAVESLSRRLENVERTLAINQASGQTLPKFSPASSADLFAPSDEQHQYLNPIVGVLSSLTKELQNLGSAIVSSSGYAHQVGEDLHQPGGRQWKRPRLDDNLPLPETHAINHSTSPNIDDSRDTPRDSILEVWDDIVDAFFRFVSPWISILHEPSVRKGLQMAQKRNPYPPVFQAMIVSSLRFVKQNDNSLSNNYHAEQTAIAKHEILFSALDGISIENTQALLILAYTEISDDQAPKASTLLGMVARHVEFLRLDFEIMKRSSPIGVFGPSYGPADAVDWIEEEERRRLFWGAVMLDRLCGSLLGCEPIVAKTKIRRRLPTCASFWGTNQPRSTPFLRVFEPSLRRSSQPASAASSSGTQSPTDPATAAIEEKQSSSGIGSLAFYIEAVESLSTIESHFLRQTVICSDSSDVSRWLMRFKDMDAYLMRWRIRLPQQWKDSGMSRRVLPGIMDPAMTAANATHNTGLLLLHERIAYPDLSLRWVQLPSLDSAEICVRAATEVSTIITKFIEQRQGPYAFAPQLGLCAFVSARCLLTQWRIYHTPLAQAYWHLLQSLDTMASRWSKCREVGQFQPISIFSRFARRLRTIHANCNLDLSFQIDRAEPLYLYKPSDTSARARHWVTPNDLEACLEQTRSNLTTTLHAGHDSTLPGQVNVNESGASAFEPQLTAPWDTVDVGQIAEGDQDHGNLLAISQSLLDPEFANMDRIISFDDMMLGNISESWDLS